MVIKYSRALNGCKAGFHLVQAKLHRYQTLENLIISTRFFSFFFQAWNVFRSLQNVRCDADQGSNKTSLPTELRTIAANKGFAVIDNKANGNCLFYALSEQLRSVKGIQISHKELRETLVQFLVKNPNLVG